MDQIIAFAPPRFDSGAAPANVPQPAIGHHQIWFTLDVDKAISFATKSKRPLLFDFTGVNCINCRLMEEKMSQPGIHIRLERFVLVQLYTDKVPKITDRAEAERLRQRNLWMQTQWYCNVTLPAYVVVTPDGKTILSTYVGLERHDGEFATFLDEGWKKWEEINE